MSVTYKVSMLGASLADPYAFLQSVFPQRNGEPSSSDGASVTVTFATAQTPVDLGSLVKIEIIPTPK